MCLFWCKRSVPLTTTGSGLRPWNHKMLRRNHRQSISSSLWPLLGTQPVVVKRFRHHHRLYLNAYKTGVTGAAPDGITKRTVSARSRNGGVQTSQGRAARLTVRRPPNGQGDTRPHCEICQTNPTAFLVRPQDGSRLLHVRTTLVPHWDALAPRSHHVRTRRSGSYRHPQAPLPGHTSLPNS